MRESEACQGFTKLEFVLSGVLLSSVLLAVWAVVPEKTEGTSESSNDGHSAEEMELFALPADIALLPDDDPSAIPSMKGRKNLPTPTGKKPAGKKPPSGGKPALRNPKPGQPKPPIKKQPGKTPAKRPAPTGTPRAANSMRRAGPKGKLIRVPEELRIILDKLADSEWNRETEVKMLAAIRRWGVKDPGLALDFSLGLERRGTRNAALGRILSTWSRESPAAAQEWFLASAEEDPFLVQDMTKQVYAWVASKDIGSAAAGVWELPTSAMRRAALQSVSQRLVALGEEQRVLETYDSAGTDADKKMVVDVVMQSIARYEPKALGEWVFALPDPKIREHGVNRLVSTWSRDHPSAAAEWVMTSLPSGKERGRQITAVTRSWVREDPLEAAEWLVTLPLQSEETDGAVDAFSRAVLPQDAGYAGDWSFSVQDNGTRWRLMEHVGRTWIKQSASAAREYINSTDLPVSTKTRLLGT